MSFQKSKNKNGSRSCSPQQQQQQSPRKSPARSTTAASGLNQLPGQPGTPTAIGGSMSVTEKDFAEKGNDS
jgi:hypothetical protein